MKSKIQTLIEKIFTTAEQKNTISKTSEKHENAEGILKRNLNEVSSLYRINSFYTLEEVTNNSEEVIEYLFSEYRDENIDLFNEAFRKNKGKLILIDKEIKKDINKKFRFESSFLPYNEEVTIDQCPDFIYEYDNNSLWVTLKEIRTSEAEKIHTKHLELLYKYLFQSNEIVIDADFSRYGITTKEKVYTLKRFRLGRNSLYIVLKDQISNELIYHNFEKIQSINYQQNDVNIKFWLYMDKGTYRFYLPKSNNINLNIPIDPLIYEVF